jgi:hypothetical protein
MGGQACVFYGAAQVSKDVDFLILADLFWRELRLREERWLPSVAAATSRCLGRHGGLRLGLSVPQ